ncbi:Uncharacterized protein HZ326_22008 [Fusarium oxysporum f. sp. albedinis]|nr:Uncharacterized protein HZ326_22008 [Fusarium oxysporum f. sp. albedinis]
MGNVSHHFNDPSGHGTSLEQSLNLAVQQLTSNSHNPSPFVVCKRESVGIFQLARVKTLCSFQACDREESSVLSRLGNMYTLTKAF